VMNPELTRHINIDLEKWDNCIEHSSQENMYAYSWYLNKVSPRWDALIWKKNNKYIAVIPLPKTKKFFMDFLVQPFYTQQLGLFSLKEENKDDNERLLYFYKFLQKKYDLVSYNINHENMDNIESQHLQINKKKNYILRLNEPYDLLQKEYDSKHLKNIKTAVDSNIIIKTNGNFNELINIFRKHQAPNIKEFKNKHYQSIKDIYDIDARRCRNLILEAYADDRLVASAFFKFHKKTFYYLFGASTEEGRKTGAASLIIDALIKDNAGKDLILNFEGSDKEGIARFFARFGAKAVYYGNIISNNRPLSLKIYQKIKHVCFNR
jgi:hypothetical protein